MKAPSDEQGRESVDDRIGLWLRLCAFAIDLGILSVLLAASFTFVAQLAILGRMNSLLELLAFMLGILTLLTPALYFWLLTCWTGHTPGKRLLSLAIVDEDGRALRLGKSFLREVIAKLAFGVVGIAIPPLYLGFLWIGWDREKRGWHDRIAGTYVVKARRWSTIRAAPQKARDTREVVSRGLIAVIVLILAWLFGTWAVDYVAGGRAALNAPGERPLSVSEPLDHGFLELGDSIAEDSTSEWQRLLRVNQGRARVVPLGPIDPAKDLLVFIPGIGVNFQDAHGLARLEDCYQVVIGIYDRRNSLDRNAQQLSEAIEEFGVYRRRLAMAQGAKPKQELRMVGHSFGGLVATLMLVNLAEKDQIDSGAESLFSEATFVNIDAPWRGFDLPWVFTLPGVKHVAREILPRLPLPSPTTRSALSVVNRTSSMNAVLDARFPPSVDVHVVSVVPPLETLMARRVEPVDGWYSAELAEGELEAIWKFLATEQKELNAMDRWEWGAFVRRQDLQQLFVTLQRDDDYEDHAAELLMVAIESDDLDNFQTDYDGVIAKIIDTFHGRHTQFMWEDEEFLPWLRTVLEG